MIRDRLVPSLRLLARHKRFSTMAVVCLALGISLNTTMYSVLDAVINPRIDMRAPEQLYSLFYYGDYRGLIPADDYYRAVSGATFHQGVTTSTTFNGQQVAERGSRLREVHVRSVATNYFPTLGVHASAGRLFMEADFDAEPRPIVLSERLWRQMFPEKDAFEPTTLHLGGTERHVVGLLSRASNFPGSTIDVWQPGPRRGWNVIRLRDGVTLAQAYTELNTIAAVFRQRTGEGTEAGFRMESAIEPAYRDWGFQYALIGSVAAVLLIACANLANLQLARGVSRARELATRAAVGASRSDLVRQLVLESAWLALGGLLVGGVMTYWGIQIIDASVPKELAQYMTYPQVSWRVFAFAIGVTLLCLTLVGVLPALKLSRVNINEVIKSGAGTGKTVSARRQYGALVVTEVALALSLLCSAGLLVKSAMQVLAADESETYRGIVFSGARVTREHPNDMRTRREWSHILINQALATDSVTRAATRTQMCPTKEGRRVIHERRPSGELLRTAVLLQRRVGRLLPRHPDADHTRPRFHAW